ncbi:RagB/SusD family nutrient uptake outer membrane protein [Arundinibacter roseus]|uniref:RagB/SusD family nutrient uptake outer membrane protein n=1 Tax=Arundinibacter roseus TaxID=2070510 RepID=A0A4R4K848_9BACT|nr:RagB/SusD family nutrient uptake outer membrane protein [Arundinibacter roseus]TDB62726.1 RagB/SusD family nutrient uptake outer membrane protein [Arundinibacter roseus]
MKKLVSLFSIFFLLPWVFSCREDEILNEVPLDFLTIENALVKPQDVENSIISLYDLTRRYFGDASSDGLNFDMYMGTDAGYHARFPKIHVLSAYTAFTADDNFTVNRWQNAYRIIFDANVILNKLNGIPFTSEDQKKRYEAEARFFRAWSYRNLVHLYGDVPLLLDDSIDPRTDYIRTPKQEVWAQIISDFEFAKDNLPDVNQNTQDGRLVQDAAYHMLAEMYIVSKDFPKAIAAATHVIGGGNYSLMTERFGSRIDEPGDVYWDLFRLNNQNRSSGNRESIWVHQVEYQTPGGYGVPTGNDANRYERIIGPEYNRFIAKGEKAGVRTFIFESTYHGGRGQGWFRPSALATHLVWQGNQDQDIRTSDANILRKWRVDNPASAFFNQIIDVGNPASFYAFVDPATIENDTNRMLYPVFLKMTMVNNHFPTELENGVGPRMVGDARRLYTDQYAIRLAETYLLRAEAYLGAGNLSKAAADINSVRARAKATLIQPSDVTLDYILDERIRELYLEEPRRLTLARLGKVYERTVKYNPYAAPFIKEHNNLYPIPSRELRINADAELKQNPGYN